MSADVGSSAALADPWRTLGGSMGWIAVFGLAAVLYARGVRRLWARAGGGRGVSRRAVACFVGALGALALALISPLDPLGGALFSAHMGQHLLLTTVAAPLWVLGRPSLPLLGGLPRWARSAFDTVLRSRVSGGLARALGRPLVAFSAYAGASWIWHVPSLYEAALRSELLHGLEHGMFFGSAAAYWGVLGRRTLWGGAAVVYLFAGAVQGMLLGALVALSPLPWYTVHGGGAPGWALSPLEDQQLAGLLMWVPGGFVYLVGALAVVAMWLDDARAAVERRERLQGRSRTSLHQGCGDGG